MMACLNDARVLHSNGTPLQEIELLNYTCPYCHKLLNDPVQVTACGDRFCRSCINKHMVETSTSNDPENKCPVDETNVDANEVYTDKGCNRELQKLGFECTKCRWRGVFSQLEDHLTKCPNEPVSLPLTGPGSGDVVSFDTQPHNAQETVFALQELPLQMLNSFSDKYQALIERTEFLVNKSSSLSNSPQEHFDDPPDHDIVATRFTEHYTPAQDRGDEQTDLVVGNLPKSKTGHKVREKKSAGGENGAGHGTNFDSLTQQSLSFSSSDSHAHSHEVFQVSPESNRGPRAGFRTIAAVSQMKQKMDSHQTQLLKISENLQTVQQSLTQHAIVIDEVRLRQDVLDVKTTNGVFIWKIPDIRRRYRDALDGRTISLYSSPFYTSPHGYRMCIRTYLNGDGIGKTTHLSVFFVLMKSNYDGILHWPFTQSIQFSLINQKNYHGSISRTLVPNPTSPSFQRPKTDMNVASGFPTFADRSVLRDNNFVIDDAMFLKCRIRCTI